MKEFILKNKYLLVTWIIIFIAFTLRFYQFETRLGVGNDDTRDIAIAHEALKRGELPLIGSFSSAGPFVFGPFFYWFLMLSYFLFPSIFLIPWIFLALTGVTTVLVLMYCAKKIAGNNFALLVGLFAALSPQLVARSVVLGQHTFVSFFTACMILFLLLFIEKKKLIYTLLMGFCLGAAINFHYQALNLLIFLPIFFFVTSEKLTRRILACLLATIGVFVALSPLIIWDSQQQFANFRNLLDYFLIGQYRLYVPNSWRLFLLDFFPTYWGFVIGGYRIIAMLTLGVIVLSLIIGFLKKKIVPSAFLLFVPFALLVFLNRYYKGERSEGYLLYLLPFILLLTSYAIWIVIQHNLLYFKKLSVIFAYGLVLLLIIGNSGALARVLSFKNSLPFFEKTINSLTTQLPNEKFTVYDYKGSLSYYNQPLSLLLNKKGLIDKSGRPIGILCYEKCPRYPSLVANGGVYLADLRNEKDIHKKNPLWINVNPENMYDDLIGWSHRHELKSTFSFKKYISDKINF